MPSIISRLCWDPQTTGLGSSGALHLVSAGFGNSHGPDKAHVQRMVRKIKLSLFLFYHLFQDFKVIRSRIFLRYCTQGFKILIIKKNRTSWLLNVCESSSISDTDSLIATPGPEILASSINNTDLKLLYNNHLKCLGLLLLCFFLLFYFCVLIIKRQMFVV